MTAGIRTHMFDFQANSLFIISHPLPRFFKMCFSWCWFVFRLYMLSSSWVSVLLETYLERSLVTKAGRHRHTATSWPSCSGKPMTSVSGPWDHWPRWPVTKKWDMSSKVPFGAPFSASKCGCIFPILRLEGFCPQSLQKCYWFKLVTHHCTFGMSHPACSSHLPCLKLICKEHIWRRKLSGHCERVWLLKIFTQSVSRKNERNVLLWVAFRTLWRSMSTKIDTQCSINLQLIKTGQIHIPLSGRMECRQFP